MLWQLGTTAQHWLYEVWIDGLHAPDAICADDTSAVVMRYVDGEYERDGLDRIKADRVAGKIELRRVNPDVTFSRAKTSALPDRFTVVECGTETEYRI